MNNFLPEQEKGQVLLYQTDEGHLCRECCLEDDTLWLTLNQMVELACRYKPLILKYLKSIYGDSELSYEATVAKYATVQIEGELDSINNSGPYVCSSSRLASSRAFEPHSECDVT